MKDKANSDPIGVTKALSARKQGDGNFSDFSHKLKSSKASLINLKALVRFCFSCHF